jgi:hypothetical protein
MRYDHFLLLEPAAGLVLIAPVIACFGDMHCARSVSGEAWFCWSIVVG